MARGIVTLTTDFGLADPYVGIMKGVILGVAPRARIVDLTHQIQPFEIAEAGFVIWQSWRYFPAGTVHVVVVDPGVGTLRRPILAEAGGHYFLGPDNGVFSMIFDELPHKVREVTAEAFFLKPVSRTFHGRDVFAPVAARLARGLSPARLGKLIRDYARQEFFKPVRSGKRIWTGTVLRADRFGNLITNFRLSEFPTVATRPFLLRAGLETITRLAGTFAEVPPGELALVEGSTGYLEIVMNQASAARKLGCGPGSPLELTLY
ncbi:MAG: SAM-dependent chlorinase/fluorinase [Bryobacterales bacterium]|nr:SAM-dependent chlorinase/fluorinase [Bryobacteraceae bacterium]MDW8131403.1 SAM-dependent chlorinase/fluorinase [Bryobacterales bacterium]